MLATYRTVLENVFMRTRHELCENCPLIVERSLGGLFATQDTWDRISLKDQRQGKQRIIDWNLASAIARSLVPKTTSVSKPFRLPRQAEIADASRECEEPHVIRRSFGRETLVCGAIKTLVEKAVSENYQKPLSNTTEV